MNSKSNLEVLVISINNIWRYPNTGVDQIVGYLRKDGFSVDIKYYHKKENYEQIINDLDLDYDVIAFSVHSANYKKCCDISLYIKETKSNVKIVWGGYFVTMHYMEMINERRCADYFVLGDGEIPLSHLLNSLVNNENNFSHHSIATYSDRENKYPYQNKLINTIPAFDYYINDTLKRNMRKVYCLQTKNNVCTGKCSFCTERKGKVVHKDISLIVDEIKYVVENFGIRQIFFTDDNIMDPNNDVTKEYVRKLCLEIKKLNLNISIECYIKAISFNDNEADNNLLKLMSEVGFATMFVGIESGNQYDLKIYNKFTTVNDNKNIVRLLRKHKIEPIIGFINFNPFSTIDSLRENYKFLIDIKNANLFQYAGTFISLQKYTEMFEMVYDEGLLCEEYSYLNNMKYRYKNKEVQEIADFVYSELRPRIVNLDMEIDNLLQTYSLASKVSSEAKNFRDEIDKIKEDYLERIKSYFYILYELNDLKRCKIESNEFLSYFENGQIRLMEIYKELVGLINKSKIYK